MNIGNKDVQVIVWGFLSVIMGEANCIYRLALGSAGSMDSSIRIISPTFNAGNFRSVTEEIFPGAFPHFCIITVRLSLLKDDSTMFNCGKRKAAEDLNVPQYMKRWSIFKSTSFFARKPHHSAFPVELTAVEPERLGFGLPATHVLPFLPFPWIALNHPYPFIIS